MFFLGISYTYVFKRLLLYIILCQAITNITFLPFYPVVITVRFLSISPSHLHVVISRFLLSLQFLLDFSDFFQSLLPLFISGILHIGFVVFNNLTFGLFEFFSLPYQLRHNLRFLCSFKPRVPFRPIINKLFIHMYLSSDLGGAQCN